MKVRDREINKRRVKDFLKQSWHNSLKCSHSPAEGRSHRNVKYMLMDYCLEHGLDFYTEATFSNGERADFIISDWVLVIEVLDSEEEKRFRGKTYPLPVLPVSAKTDFFSLNVMLDDLATCNGQNFHYYEQKYWKKVGA